MAEGQYKQGWQPSLQFHDKPGSERKMNPAPLFDELPNSDDTSTKYRSANKLQGKKALITGGDSGIGRSIAVLYALEGAEVYVIHLPDETEDAEDTKKLVEKAGGKIHLQPADLRSSDVCKDVIDKARKAMGAINILVLNHATQTALDDINQLSEEIWHQTFDTNIHSYFYLAKYTRPHLKAGDSIITNASVNAYIGRPDLLDYTATKGAIISFTRGLGNQLVGEGIRVNAVAPGPVWTPLIVATMTEEQQKSFTSPMGRPAQPSEIATSFVFLASQDSAAFTGQTLHPNGGSFTTS